MRIQNNTKSLKTLKSHSYYLTIPAELDAKIQAERERTFTTAASVIKQAIAEHFDNYARFNRFMQESDKEDEQ